MSGNQTILRRSMPAVLALTLLALPACGAGSSDGAAAAAPAVGGDDDGGCPLSVDQIAELTGVAVQGGDAPAAPDTLACSFYFSFEGRPAVLTGVPLPSSLKRLDRLNAKAGADRAGLKALGPGAFRYLRSDPTSEAGLAYEAAALLPDNEDRHVTYKMAILLPTRDPSVDLTPLLAKLTALLAGLERTNPISPKVSH